MFTKILLKNIRQVKWFLERKWGEDSINYRDQGQINFIDVGAIGWLPPPWNLRKNTAKICHLLRFEPQEYSGNSSHVTTIDSVLWENDCERDFYFFSGAGGGASLFEQNYEYVRENYNEISLRGDQRASKTWFERSKFSHKIKVKCHPLDKVLAGLQPSRNYHFLKVDAQGAEYQILRGGENLLRTSCIGIHLELFVMPLFKGAKLMPEVIAYLAGLDFELVKQYPAHGTFDSQHDCVFIKKNSSGGIVNNIREIYCI